MSESAAPSDERFVLARRGLPLAGSVPAQPGAAWLPAAVRSGVQAVAARQAAMLPIEEEEAQEEGAWWNDRGADARPVEEEGEGGAALVATPVARSRSRSQETSAGRAITQPRSLAGEGPAAPHVMTTSDDAPPAALETPRGHLAAKAGTEASRDDTPRAMDTPMPVAREAGVFEFAHADAHARTPQGPAIGAPPAKHPPTLPTLAVSPPARHAIPSRGESQAASLPVGIQRPAPAGATPAEPITIAVHEPSRQAAAAPRTPATDLPAAPRTILMGLPAHAAADARPMPAAPDLTVLLAPAPAPQRSITIDRIAVTVQAPATQRAASPAAAATPAPPRVAHAAPAAFRNPWASYHARRD